MPPLNPKLYQALKQAFGTVKISNEGIPMCAVYVPGPDGRPQLQPVSKGEYYVTVCPYCHDTVGHLYVNHRWGVRDPINNTYNLWLANCFLGNCLQDWDKRVDLANRLNEYNLQARMGAVTVKEISQPSPLSCRDLPSDFQSLSELGEKHRAIRYVRNRGFCPKELGKNWGVGFSMDAYRSGRGRLVIPLSAQLDDTSVDGGNDKWQVVGFQGRALNDEDKPKYLTSQGTPKSRLLYGLEQVGLNGETPVVVCEGPTDVWRVGPGAVALLGKTVSTEQCKLLRKRCPDRDFVVLLDPEADEEATVVAERLRTVLDRNLSASPRTGRVVVAHLADDRDPAECTREELWSIITRALRRSKKKKKRRRSS